MSGTRESYRAANDQSQLGNSNRGTRPHKVTADTTARRWSFPVLPRISPSKKQIRTR